MEDFDSAEQNFEGEKICLENINMGNYSILEGEDRCPSLVEKSSAQFVFRVVLYLVMFIINVILLNVLIGQISITLERVMKEGDTHRRCNRTEQHKTTPQQAKKILRW